MATAICGALFARVQAVVEGVLRRELGTHDPDYDDLVQSSLERVLVTIAAGKFGGDCPVHVWAATVARCVAIDAIRERARDRLVFDRSESEESLGRRPSPDDDPEHVAEIRHYLDEIVSALSRLAPEKAHVVYLHDILGYELKEVATTMGMSVAAAQSRLVRGRHQIFDSAWRLRARLKLPFGNVSKESHNRFAHWRFISGYETTEISACRQGPRTATTAEGSKSLRKGRGP